ncbi:cytochrome c3 family protein [Geobacter sp. FeAm09]|uniref:cytochrome c3 family protein n=1 Tax=Geobacter sp. FeAm09 TaxID=2597769 RepID=UPI0011ED01EB|nr:cytochrome c3 family protein [Geobacter sp. FeAm09]QEM67516.1 cytochrome c3 family protein [Geobacter sp. FeAm09]
MNKEAQHTGYLLCMLFLAVAALTSATADAKDREPLAKKHLAQGVKCQDCHAIDKLAAPAEVAACLNCHGGYAGMAKRTAKKDTNGGYLSNINPHESHFGDVECTECHVAHNAPHKSICDRCHTFTFDM